ncbi:MAG: hypothetical protein IKD50_00310, partial [Clostridia bacterium]|nr:hypothetical protein [Clostridia bacterium]
VISSSSLKKALDLFYSINFSKILQPFLPVFFLIFLLIFLLLNHTNNISNPALGSQSEAWSVWL